jgi:hypothetical protein
MIKLAKDFLSELELNILKKPNIINEHSTKILNSFKGKGFHLAFL